MKLPYRINLSSLTEIRHNTGSVKHIRRVQQAPYPLTKVTPDIELFGTLQEPTENIVISRHSSYQSPSSSKVEPTESSGKSLLASSISTKSKKLFPNLVKSKQQMASTLIDTAAQSTQLSYNSSSSSSSKLARQIFNNLNIFSNKHHDQQHIQQSKQSTINNSHVKPDQVLSLMRNLDIGQNGRRLSSKSNSSTASTQNLIVTRRCRRSYRSQDDEFYLETDGSSCYSTTNSSNGICIRRPSLDTISTYLSHESNDRLNYGATECTYEGDDDVFLPRQNKANGSIVGVDADSDMISRFVHVEHPPKWPNCRPCVICLEELTTRDSSTNPAVSLIRCEHLMHLSCLNHLIISESETQKQVKNDGKSSTLYIECPVCGIVYGEKYE